MKKVLFLIVTLVCAVTGVWAGTNVSLSGGTLTITTTDAGTLFGRTFTTEEKAATSLVLIGNFNTADLQAIQTSGNDFKFTSVDLSQAKFVDVYTPGNRPEGSVSGYEWFKTEATGSNTTKAIVGGTLYKASVQTEKVWTSGGEVWNATAYTDVAARDAAKESLPVGTSFAKIPKEGKFKFCQMIQTPTSYDHNPKEGNLGEEVDWATDQNARGQHVIDGPERIKYYSYFILQGNEWYSQWQQSDANAFNNAPEGTIKLTAGEGDASSINSNNKESYKSFAFGTVLRIPFYYEKIYEKAWQDLGSGEAIPSTYVDGNFTYNNRNNNKDAFNVGQWVRMFPDDNNDYDCYTLTENVISRSWNAVTDKDNAPLSYVYTTLPECNANDGEYAVVGGNEYVYDGSSWVLASSATSIVNPQLMKFTYWSGSLQTAILPAAITAAELPSDVLQNCNSLTRLESGETYAVIQNDNGRRATIYTFEDSEYERVKAILNLNNFVNQFTQARPETTDYIKKVNTTDDFYTVHVTGPGRIKWLLAEANVPDNAVLKFDSECTGFTADDLAALAGKDNQNFNKYYVDLYDVAYSGTEDAIKGAIDIMREKNWQYKGLLLPKDPEKVGTSLIADRAADNQKLATCSEFIAYNNGTTTVMHIYSGDQNAKVADYNRQFGTLKSMTDRHNGTYDIGRTEQYIISTNCKEKLTVSALPATATVIMTTNNDMVNTPVGNVKMYVKSVEVGDFAAAVDNTNMQNTNIDQVEIEGRVDADDILSINDFLHGPEELIMKEITYVGTVSKEVEGQTVEVTTPIKNVLSCLTNTSLQYIVLPAGLSKEDVCDEDIYYNTVENEGTTTKVKKMPSLKAVISSNSTNLVAYVAEAGSLISARSLATGPNGSNPAAVGLTTVTLGGNLNATDIAAGGSTGGLQGEGNTITSIDLEYAYFATAADMKLGDNGGASLKSLRDVKLPTDPRMEVIPAECFHNVGTLQSIHIPYNYKEIKARAFEGTVLSHITTEDANHSLIDNGPNTYTFSANISVLGEKDQNNYVFPEGAYVTDVYCLAMKTPKCYLLTFPPNMVYANGGIYAGPYCRDKYIDYKDGQPKNAVTLLHFPSQESFDNATNKETIEVGDPYGVGEDAYKQMVMKYTDPERDYHKIDQTGAVDANGNPLKWPDQGEVNNTRGMAVAGHTWEDYKDMTYQVGGTAHQTGIGNPYGNQKPFYPNYAGWHEFVLTQATYVKPDEHVVDDVVYNYYVDAGWYTICIPFDLSYNDVVKMLGVPKSTAKEKSYIVENGVARDTEEADDLMPDIRQLLSVERKKGSGSQNNEIVFRLTTNLALPSEHTANYLDFSEGKVVSPMPKAKKEGESADNPTCMVGGRPYIIKAYKRTYKNGESFVDETIPSQNIGLYILKHYADDFKESASCLKNEGYYEQLKKYTYKDLIGDKYEVDQITDGGETMKFAKPYEDHKVQAVNGSEEDAGELTFTEGDKTKRYYYTMVGQFWDQNLPQYSVYMSKGKWYRYTDPSRNYKWAAYKCVIMATPEVDQDAINSFTDDDLPDAEKVMDQICTSGAAKPSMPKIPVESLQPGGNFRYFKNCFFPMNMPGTNDLISGPMKLAFFGRDDHDFNVPGHHQVGFPAPTRYMFVLDGDEEVVELDENGNSVTAIATLDGETQGTAGTSKVYNLSGQYVGNSTEGLSKGIYIVDGRKIVVD